MAPMSSQPAPVQTTSEAPAYRRPPRAGERRHPGGRQLARPGLPRAVGGTPRFMASGSGPWLTDADGKRYVDLICSWGR